MNNGGVAAFVTRYRSANPQSAELYERLRRVMPGGETRAVTYFQPFPLGVAFGRGSSLTDVDGHTYLDMLNNYTSLVHGHAFPPITEAIIAATSAGTAYPAPTELQFELAELLCQRYPAVEALRFTNSGTEAAGLALRIARRATGRRLLLLFEGGYHGTAAEFADDGPDRVTVPFNDVGALREALNSEVAAVFVEPFLGSGGVVAAAEGFLLEVQAQARRRGTVFVLDEVQALRNAYNGTHAAMGLEPDLVLMGKIIGGGMPVGAVGGRRTLLDLTAGDRADGLRHSGTFNGNPVTMAAGLASMRALTPAAIDELNSGAEQLQHMIATAANSNGVPATINRAGSILQVHVVGTDRRLNQTESAPDEQALLHLALLGSGVYAAPRGMLNLSTVMSEADLLSAAEAYQRAFVEIGDASSWEVAAGGSASRRPR